MADKYHPIQEQLNAMGDSYMLVAVNVESRRTVLISNCKLSTEQSGLLEWAKEYLHYRYQKSFQEEHGTPARQDKTPKNAVP